jgi:valyl-tRNA synthetase
MSTASPATTPNQLPPKYDPASVEAEIFASWISEGCFHADPNAPGEPYCIVIPPPNVTGALHLGHAINNTLQDILIRVHRMKGFNTLWVPGVDHAGIATQAVVEKQLKEKENKTRHDVGREGLVERIWQWKNEYGDRIVSQLKRLGCSCDWDRLRFTLDDMCAKAVRETFFKMFKDGKVFRGKRLVNWDTHLQTSISDDELYTETVKTNLWSIRYPVVDAQGSVVRGQGSVEHVTIATTRPETMLADTAVAYHSSNPHAAFLKGKFVKLPLTGRLIPLIEDDILVDPEFGTGYVKVTPGHDPNDYAVYTRHKGTPTEIGILNMMTPDGKVNDAEPSWAAYTGMKLETVARKKVLEDLVAAGLHDPEGGVKPHEANVNFSDRSKTAIQPYLSDQWFVRMAELAEPALEVVRNGTIKFFPERHAQQYLAWLGEKRDWPISRQLWWGHRIPVWSKTVADSRDVFMELDQLNDDGLEEIIASNGKSNALVVVDALTGEKLKPSVLELNHGLKRPVRLYLCLGPDVDNTKWERNGWVQDPDVLDTWFSSGLWPHSTLGWPEHTPELAKWYPGSVLLTGRDIITLWVARMVMMGMYNMGGSSTGILPVPAQPNAAIAAGHGQDARATANDRALGIPFKHVAINPTILDGKGERMSKSKGNGVDPVDIIDTHGADALRFTMATMATETQDVRLPVKKDAQGRNTSEKFDLGRNFCTKLWNASRFAMTQLGGQGSGVSGQGSVRVETLSLADRWILSRLAATLSDIELALSTYRFDAYAKAVYDFFWRDFCDWYVEAIKPAMKDPARAPTTAAVLGAVLDASLRLLHPIIPFITEAIWANLNQVRADRSLPGILSLLPAKRLVKAPWPAGPQGNLEEAAHVFPRLQDVIGAIRNLRNEYKVEPKKTVTVCLAPPGEEATKAVLSNRELIEHLAVSTLSQVAPNLPAPANAAKASVNGCDVYIEGLIDPDAEKNRVAKRREELSKLIATLEGRLASPSYTDKAPAHLVQQTRQQLEDAKVELGKLG